ncbi:MAG: N-acetyltransferase [Planctomycetes bacterium]|nr:N-acetyltransferase [Planctomycetota bacterium]MCW8136781.1 N-acetyltransferase [Planctomycetota bacterium]
MRLRREEAADVAAIRAVNLAAFPKPAEADLVDRLRGHVDPFISLVADDGGVAGHILFTPVHIGARTALALGPMAVLPARQRHGIGGKLIRAALDACLAAGHDLVFVLGHPEYYPRFGFKPTRPFGIRCEFEVPADVFMLAELRAGAAAGISGIVRYHDLFKAVDGS